MRLVSAFFRMIRLPNLVFIALAQFLFHVGILHPILDPLDISPAIEGLNYILLTIASVLIAAAGYTINDYFDVNIDQVNKPRLNVVDSVVSRRWAMFWHFVLSGIGILLSLYIAWKSGLWYIAIANFFCVILLFAYSATFKKKLLWGNVLISLLTAWVILIFCLSELRVLSHVPSMPEELAARQKIVRLGIMYAGFAFIISLIREAIKDMEDIQGDARNGCHTMPISWGINVTKVYVAVWLVVLIAALVVANIYVVPFEWWWPVVYSMVLIILPLLFTLYGLYRAETSSNYHSLSNWTKLIMLTGILSMGFFYFYL